MTSHKQWERASGCVSSDVTQFKVSRLEEGQAYLFQVSAENDQGCGPALTTDFETLAKNPFGQLSRLPKFSVHNFRHFRPGTDLISLLSLLSLLLLLLLLLFFFFFFFFFFFLGPLEKNAN